MKLETQRRIDELKAEKDALGKRKYEEKYRKEESPAKKEVSMTMVYVDVALMLFCFFTVILAPLGLFFAVTAIMKYKATKEPRA